MPKLTSSPSFIISTATQPGLASHVTMVSEACTSTRSCFGFFYGKLGLDSVPVHACQATEGISPCNSFPISQLPHRLMHSSFLKASSARLLCTFLLTAQD